MIVEIVFHIKYLGEVKFWVEQSVLQYNIKKSEIVYSILFHPVCQQKLLTVYALPYFTHYMKVACWHKGWNDILQDKNAG